MKKHLRIYLQLLSFTLKHNLEYRWNALVQFLYAPSYAMILFLIVQLIYTKTPTLGGWNIQETLLLFAVFHVLYALFLLVFIGSLRWFMFTAIPQGELDFILTKPVSPRFFVAVSQPNIHALLYAAMALGLFIRQCIFFAEYITLVQFLLFFVSLVLGFLIGFLALSTYATIAFYVNRAHQLIELFDKVSDFSQYPTSIFPASIQIFSVTVIPFAFFAFIPTQFLLGKLEASWLILPIAAVIIFYFLNALAWKKGLQHYSSASS